MFVHTVLFWLKDLSPDQLADFTTGLDELIAIESVSQGWYGQPASTDRPIIDTSYSYGLTIINTDLAAHQAYQDDPIHDRFRDRCHPYFDKVVIYDYETDQ
ncbi:MAG: Dabb family protein [Planctomycetota bacterium]|nr:Dabb family protein [Planctomycetota bacterium]